MDISSSFFSEISPKAFRFFNWFLPLSVALVFILLFSGIIPKGIPFTFIYIVFAVSTSTMLISKSKFFIGDKKSIFIEIEKKLICVTALIVVFVSFIVLIEILKSSANFNDFITHYFTLTLIGGIIYSFFLHWLFKCIYIEYYTAMREKQLITKITDISSNTACVCIPNDICDVIPIMPLKDIEETISNIDVYVENIEDIQKTLKKWSRD